MRMLFDRLGIDARLGEQVINQDHALEHIVRGNVIEIADAELVQRIKERLRDGGVAEVTVKLVITDVE